MLFSSAVGLALLNTAVSAKDSRTFAVNHFYGKGPLTEGRADPIISPGGPSGHVHTIQGGNAFALTLEDDTLLSSTCTSSLIKNDLSAYWSPKLYFQDPKNGSFIDVPLFYMNVYYFFEATDDEIKAFQPGHRMVIGNPTLRTPPSTGGASILDPVQGPINPVQWTCPRSSYNPPSYPADSDGLHGVGIQDPNNKGAGAGFPDEDCDGYASPMRADIHFPSCYNPEAGLDDYKNNMAWPSSNGTTGGKQNCPSGWVHTPHLFYELYWNTGIFTDLWEQGQGYSPWCLAEGDCMGYSLHADFVSGWDVATLQQIIDNCDAGDNGMDKCPGLIGGVNDPSTSCNIANPYPETITGVLEKLPGNNPITGWSQFGTNPVPAANSSTSSGTSTGSGSSATGSSPAAVASGSSSTPVPAVGSGPSSSMTSAAPAGSTRSTGSGTKASSFSPALSMPTTHTDTPTSGSSSSESSSSSSTGSGSSGSGASGVFSLGSSTATVTAEAAASQSSSCTVTAFSNVTLPDGWTSTGCYSDNLDNRVLSGITFAYLGSAGVSTSSCVAYCDQQGFNVAGTEYGSQCFCGTSLSGSNMQPTSKCDMKCDADESQICGGSLTLSVYTKSPGARVKRYLHHKQQHLAKRSIGD